MPQSDTYIAKDSSVNDEIDKLRLSATAALTERKDVIVVASVSCIYGLGSPDEWTGMSISLRPGQERDRDDLARALIDLQYTRNDMDFTEAPSECMVMCLIYFRQMPMIQQSGLSFR